MSLKNLSAIAANNTLTPPFGAPESSTKLKDYNDCWRYLASVVRHGASSNTIASAATCDLGSLDEAWLTVSGITTITSFGTVSAGIYKLVTFSGALTLTHNATSLILLGGANRTTVAGDCGLYLSLGGGNWKEYFYSPVSTSSYQPLDAQLTTLAGITVQQAADLAAVSTYIGTLLNDADAATARATLGASALGVGQTWQNVAASRAINTTYTNTTGKPIMVSVTVSGAVANSTISISFTVAGVAGISNNGTVAGPTPANTSLFATAIVPIGATYSVVVTQGTIANWLELS